MKILQRRLKKKIKGSNNWLKLQGRSARFHEKVANTRKDWHFNLAHYLCDQADNIFVENINFKSWSKGLFCRQSLDSGIGGFINEILPFVCWKRGKYYLKVDKNGTSQECSSCGASTGKKELGERIHVCQFCSHTESRDTNSAKIIRDRGIAAVGHIVREKRDNAVFARGNAGVSPAYSTLAAGVSPHSRTSPMSDCRKKACGVGLAGIWATVSSQEAVKQESPATATLGA